VSIRGSTVGPFSFHSWGFTLVELVIALALVGLIVLLLFSGLRLGTHAWEGVETISERTADPRIAHNFLARVLTQARSARVSVDAEDVLVFAGDAETLELVAPLTEHVGTPGLYVLKIALEGDGQLVLTRWLLHPDVLAGTGDIPEWEPFKGGGGVSATGILEEDLAAGAYGRTLLLSGVDELEIAYYGVSEGEEDPDWHQDWIEQSRMPQAVRIRLSTVERTWPDMLIRLHG